MPSYEEVTQRAGSRRSMTGLTEAEFMALLPRVEPAFVDDLQDHPIDGQPRTRRRYRTYDTCPLPTTAAKLRFIRTYVTQNPLQEVQGQLFGMSQAHANQWIQLRPPVWDRALADQALLPARTADDLAARLTTPPTDASAPSARFFMRGADDPSSVRQTRRSRKHSTAGRRKTTRAKTSW
jgi:hypothetical protein